MAEKQSTDLGLVELLSRFCGSLLQQVDDEEISECAVLLTASDSPAHLNSYLCVEDGYRSGHLDDALKQSILRRALNPDRSVAVVPDDGDEHLRSVRSLCGKHGIRTATLSSLLDSYLRPELVCHRLVTGENSVRRHSALEYAGAPDLLDEAVFIDPRGYSESGQIEIDGVRNHLFRTWAAGSGPRFVALIAPAGYGKSMLSHQLARQLALAYQASVEQRATLPPLPFLISFGNFRRGSSSFNGLVLESLEADGPPLVTADAFKELLDLGRVNFILDGFDEMIESNAEMARQNVRDFIENAGSNARILLTSRSTFFRTRADVESEFQTLALTDSDVEILELRPFSNAQVREYANRRVVQGRSQALNRVHRILDEDSDLAEATKNPMFLREFVDVLNEEPFKIKEVRERGILNYLVTKSLAREQIRQAHSLSPAAQQVFIEATAVELLTTPSLDREDIELVAMMAVPELESGIDAESDLSSLLNHCYLEGSGVGHTERYRMHQIWREYFQATAIADSPTERFFHETLGRASLSDGTSSQIFQRLSYEELLNKSTPPSVNQQYSTNWVRLALHAAGSSASRFRNLVAKVGGLEAKQITHMSFKDLSFRGLSFRNAILISVLFENCDLTDVDMNGTTVRSAVFRGCKGLDSLLVADLMRVEIDGDLVHHKEQLGFTETAEPPVAGDARLSIRELLKSRLKLFVFTRGEAGLSAVRGSMAESALVRGVDRQYQDFIRRDLFPAARRAGILDTSPIGRKVVVTARAEAFQEILDFVEKDQAGPRVRDALVRLERRG